MAGCHPAAFFINVGNAIALQTSCTKTTTRRPETPWSRRKAQRYLGELELEPSKLRSIDKGRRGAMKVVFLDIDGVLNCNKTSNPRKLPYIVDRRLLKRLKRLLERTGAKVVLSSTWRYDPAGLFSAKCFRIPFIGVTPDMPKRPRRDEIRAWVKRHPRVTRLAVIDDEDDDLDELPLFQPSAATGLDEKHCAWCRKIFGWQN
jgi:HAD domain in Swiss Army Knife RNA repair proteins